MLLRLLIFGLAAYGFYTLFFKNKRIVIQDRQKPKTTDKNYTDYEEL